MSGWEIRVGLVASALLLSALIAEAGLRVWGFSFEIAPHNVEFGAPNPQLIRFNEYDRDLFWVRRGYRTALQRLESANPDIVFTGLMSDDGNSSSVPPMVL